MIDSRPKKAKWIGRINCNWLKFLKSTQYGYEFSNDLKNITASTDDNSFNIFDNIKVIADSGYGVKDETVKNGIRECKIDFEQLNSNNKVVKECSMNVSQKCISDKCKKDDSEDEITYKVNSISINPSSKDGLPYSGGTLNLKGYADITKITTYPLYWCGTNKKTGEYSATTETFSGTNSVNITRDSLSVWSISNPRNRDSISNGELTYAEVTDNRDITVNLGYSGKTATSILKQNHDTNTYKYVLEANPPSLEWNGNESGSSVEKSVKITCNKITNEGTDNEKIEPIGFDYSPKKLDHFYMSSSDGKTFSFYPLGSNYSESDYNEFLTINSSIANKSIPISLTQSINNDKPSNSDEAFYSDNMFTLVFNREVLNKPDKQDFALFRKDKATKLTDISNVYVAINKITNDSNNFQIDEIPISEFENANEDSKNKRIYKNTWFYVLNISNHPEYIINNNKIIVFIKTVKNIIPNEMEYYNSEITACRVPSPYTKMDNACLYVNKNLQYVFLAPTIIELISDCLAGLSSLKELYIGADKAPILIDDKSQGETFNDTVNKNPSSPSCTVYGVKGSSDSYNKGFGVWEWPGCLPKGWSINTDFYTSDQELKIFKEKVING